MKSQFFKPARRGAALVIVLGVLVLLLGLIVAFISRAGSERASSASYTAANSSRNLADLAVNLVQGQINHATTLGADKAWASQPGALRVFNTAGSLEKIYRLYSAESLSATTAAQLAADLPPDDWASRTALWRDLNAPASFDSTSTFPIFDPTSIGAASAPQGLSVTSAPGATAGQPAPMPVRWLYVLKDGTLAAPGAGTTEVDVPGADATNPITGRIAFWTDDETCRVNVNTASEGTYWDTPRADTNQERQLANFQPARKEFQRYPGHPAMTSLSTVFPGLSPDEIYAIVPRIVGGGSDAGTRTAPAALTPDSDRLYSSVGELLYNKDRGANGLSKALLEQAKFVLTAQSRAPEINLFNLPKVAIWPIYRLSGGQPDPNRTTAFDRLIARCATVNDTPYFFQRQNADSPTNDISIPGNSDLYSYLQSLTGDPIPGFGGNFSSKYGSDRDQILTEVFDYIRSTNLYDDLLVVGNQFTDGRGSTASDVLSGHGWVIPTVYNNTTGFGRAYSITEVAIAFICNAAADDPATAADESAGSNTTANPAIGAGGTILAANEKIIQALLIPELFSPMQGWTAICPDLSVSVSGLSSLRVRDSTGTLQPLYGSDTATVNYTTNPGGFWHGRFWGGNPAWRYAARTTAGFGNPLISNRIRISTASGLEFSGGQLVFELKSSTGNAVFQRTAVDLPASSGSHFPIPAIANSGTNAGNNNSPSATTKDNWWDLGWRVGNGSTDPGYNGARLKGAILREDFDVLRSVVPSHGDFRLTAAYQTFVTPAVSDPAFVKHPDYDDPAVKVAADLTHFDTGVDLKPIQGNRTYFAGITFSPNRVPDVPRNASQRPDATGDVDNGVSVAADGPYINKPDEGNSRGLASSKIPYFDSSYIQELGGATFFSPNRIMPSPGMIGSLPTGVKAGVPWRTLLFRPQTGHPSHSTTIPDHLLLDFFWMPVVEPYAISEPFSTAGKINMNYQIQPFTYIERSTGLRAALKSEMLAAIPDANAASYKTAVSSSGFRLAINAGETLKQFEARFTAGGIFKSATEICDIHIIPQGTLLDATGSNADTVMNTFWSTRRLTGDNLRERIYTTLYPRLTTKSNSYTVYYTVQALANPPASDQTKWNESKGRVLSEYRGSTSLERYIDPEDPNVPDYAAAADPTAEPTLDRFYRWRITGARQFAP